MLGGAHERKRGRTECGRDVGVRALPGVQVVEPAAEEYPEESEERMRAGRKDTVELEERVKVEHRWVGHRRGDRVQRGGLCRLRCGVERADVYEFVVVGRVSVQGTPARCKGLSD